MNDFFELNLRSMTMDEYERRFVEILKYVDFVNDDQVKIQRFLSDMPTISSDNV